MKTIVSMSGGYGSAYNLWQLAKNTDEEITVIFIDIEYYNTIYAPCPTGTHLSKRGDIFAANQITNWVNKNVRKVSNVVLDLDNYDPVYSGIPSLEISNYAKIHEYDKIILSDDIKDITPDQLLLRKVMNRMKGNYFVVEYPLMQLNLTNYQCSKLLPIELKELCVSNKMCDISYKLENSGLSVDEIIKKQIKIASTSILDQSHMPQKNNVWVNSEDKDFGTILFNKDLKYQYAHYMKLWKANYDS
jgi:hypothetical protein